MNSDRWKHIDDVLQSALDLAPGQREPFLRRVCAGDEALEREVRSLLRSDERAGGFLEDPAVEVAAKALARQRRNEPAPETPDPLLGLTVSHYLVVEKLGSGGMGVVYKAEDRRLGRFVALKFLSDSFARDPKALHRFRREARTASALNHPNICSIFDVGEQDGRAYIVMEFLEGETLRQHIGGQGLAIESMVTLGVQIADGLEAAHRAGVIHRDIKPGNIFVTRGGVVKIVDFGLAQLAVPEDGAEEPITEAGAALGTAGYMSPEQLRGLPLDSRSDLFSFGVVLVEMATGSRPVAGAGWASQTPSALAGVLAKCLEYDPDLRFQHASEVRERLEQLRSPGSVRGPVVWRNRRVLVTGVAATILICCGAGAAYVFTHRAAPKLTAKDTIVLADFVNRTGDAVFDGALRQGLAVQLGQSPYLSLISDQRIRRTLRFMSQPATAPLTLELAKGVCERTGGAAVVEGSIAPMGASYVIGLRATNCRTGAVIDEEQAQASRKEEVLQTLGQISRNFRMRVGESVATIRQPGGELPEASTRSIEALQAYSDGLKAQGTSSPAEALRLFERAVEIDPDFAIALDRMAWMYNDLDEFERSMEFAGKAYRLRDRVSDEERLQINVSYERLVTGNVEKVWQLGELWARTYPRALLPHAMLGGSPYAFSGSFEQAIGHARKAIEFDPDFAMSYYSLSNKLLILGRVEEAEEVLERAFARKLQIQELYYALHNIAFYKHDDDGRKRAMALSKSARSDAEALTNEREAFALAYYGRLNQARVTMRHGIDAALQAGQRERAAEWQAGVALWEAFFGNAMEARRDTAAALRLAKGRDLPYAAALSLALLGDTAQPQSIVRDLERRFPEDSSIQFSYLPVLRAKIALNHRPSDPAQAIELLGPAIPFELGVPRIGGTVGIGGLYPVYVRGEAYLAAHQGAKAAAEFQRIIEHPGIVLSDPMGVAARLQLARALALVGEVAKAKSAYREFLTLWKDADPGIPILEQAKSEFARLP